MRFNSLTIDNFYSDPMRVREFALSQEFAVRGNYPGQRTLLSMTDVPYYESYVKDSVDFLINLGLRATDVYIIRNPWPNLPAQRRWYYVPVIIGFKRTRMVYNTNEPGVCYCVEGAAETILKLNPEFLSNIE